MPHKFASVDEYIDSFPADVRPVLSGLRSAVHAAVPDAEESISYDMPTFAVRGKALVYFAGWKHHVSLYPVPRADADLESRIAPLRAAKDTVRFPLGKPVPLDLVERIVAFMAARRSGGE